MNDGVQPDVLGYTPHTVIHGLAPVDDGLPLSAITPLPTVFGLRQMDAAATVCTSIAGCPRLATNGWLLCFAF